MRDVGFDRARLVRGDRCSRCAAVVEDAQHSIGALHAEHRDGCGFHDEAPSFYCRHVEPACDQDGEEVAVGEHDDGAIVGCGVDAFDCAVGAHTNVLCAFAAFEVAGPFRPAGFFGDNVGVGATFVLAVVPLQKVVIEDERSRIVSDAGDLGGLPCSLER